MSDELSKFNTLLLDTLIDCIVTLKNATIVTNTGTGTVNPADIAILAGKVTVLTQIRDKFRNLYEDKQKEIASLIEQINSND
jgi:uncharacterized protein YerC